MVEIRDSANYFMTRLGVAGLSRHQQEGVARGLVQFVIMSNLGEAEFTPPPKEPVLPGARKAYFRSAQIHVNSKQISKVQLLVVLGLFAGLLTGGALTTVAAAAVATELAAIWQSVKFLTPQQAAAAERLIAAHGGSAPYESGVTTDEFLAHCQSDEHAVAMRLLYELKDLEVIREISRDTWAFVR